MATFYSRRRQKKRKINLPCLNAVSLQLVKNWDRLLKIVLKLGLTIDKQKFTTARNKVTQILHKAEANFFMTITERAKGNGKKNSILLINSLLDRIKKTRGLEITS